MAKMVMLPSGKKIPIREHKKEYLFYRGDDIVSSGTIDKISRETGVSISTLKFYGSPSHKRRFADKPLKNQPLLVPYDEEDCDEAI